MREANNTHTAILAYTLEVRAVSQLLQPLLQFFPHSKLEAQLSKRCDTSKGVVTYEV